MRPLQSICVAGLIILLARDVAGIHVDQLTGLLKEVNGWTAEAVHTRSVPGGLLVAREYTRGSQWALVSLIYLDEPLIEEHLASKFEDVEVPIVKRRVDGFVVVTVNSRDLFGNAELLGNVYSVAVVMNDHCMLCITCMGFSSEEAVIEFSRQFKWRDIRQALAD